jgi:hypothetical protein
MAAAAAVPGRGNDLILLKPPRPVGSHLVSGAGIVLIVM